jgi:hypothetical protein
MDSTDNVRERIVALEQQMKVMGAHTRTVERRLRWWRGLACGGMLLGLVSLPLQSGTAADTQPRGIAERLAAVEKKLGAMTLDDAANEVVITGANLRIVNGLGRTNCIDDHGNPIPNCPNGLGNLIVGYNEPRPLGDQSNFGPDDRTGSHNVVVGSELNFSSFGGLVVGVVNGISGEFASVSGGIGNIASGTWSSVSGGFQNTASNDSSSVSGGLLNKASGNGTSVSGGQANTASGVRASICGGVVNMASGIQSSVSGGFQNTASGFRSSVSGGENNTASGEASSVSGGSNRTAPDTENWAAGALFSDN